MKRLVSILLATLAVSAWTGAALAATAPSRIQAVTVYSDRARVVRTAEAAVTAGLNEIQLQTTAFHLDHESVMARVFGEGELFGVQYRQVPIEAYPQEKIETLRSRLRDLERALEALNDEKAVLDRRRAFLDSFIEFSKVQVPREIQTRLPDAPALESTLTFVERGYTDANAQQQALDLKIEARRREIDAARRELAALEGRGAKEIQIIEILFQSPSSQTVRIEAEYQVAGAYWRPLYRAAVPETADSVALSLFASLNQKSGEDWQEAALTVSNALPLSGARLPDLAPWIVDMPRPIARKAPIRAMDAQALGVAPAPAAEAEKAESDTGDAEAALAQAEVRRSTLAVEYTLPRPVTVASQDKETLLPVSTRNLKGQFHYLAVPKVRPTAFLVCQSQADSELLPGPMQVYFSGQYLGKTQLSEMRAGGTFDLNLGADRSVLVRREKVLDKRRETFFGQIERDTVAREIAYRITLENLKDRPVTVQLLDHVPVSRTDRIRIADLAFEPAPNQRDDQGREGVMRWERRLEPGQKETVEIRFSVSYPKEIGVPDF